MDKKELKWYETPAIDVVELEIRGMLCVSGDDDDVPDEDDV